MELYLYKGRLSGNLKGLNSFGDNEESILLQCMDISKIALNIENILGSSATKISHLAHAQGCILYPAGNVIVFYSPILDEQVAYLPHSTQFISSIVVSPNQQLLAVCDSTKHGYASVYSIQNIQNLKGVELKTCWTLKGHKFGIDLLQFSPNGKYIVTLSNQDGSMFLWQAGQTSTKNRISKTISKIIFSKKGDLLTIGRGYLKLWPFQNGNVIKKQQIDGSMLQGKVMTFGKKFSSQDFIDGTTIIKPQGQRLILLSSDGLICIFSPGYQKIEKWIDVMMQGVTALEVVNSIVICCGDHALVKAIDLDTLTFKYKFPKPPPNSRENLSEQEPLQCLENDEFPKCLGAKKVGSFIVTLYSNRSMFVWRIQNEQVQAVRSVLSHRAKVTSLTILDEMGGGQLVFFASSADDHTLRLWHCYAKDESQTRKSADLGAVLGLRRNVYCKHLTHIIYTHSQLPINQIKALKPNKIACIARQQFMIYSLQNFGLFLLEPFDDDRLICLETNGNNIIIGTESKKILVFELKEDRLQKKIQVLSDIPLQNVVATSNRIFIGGKGQAKCLNYDGEVVNFYGKANKIGLTGNYLLICQKNVLTITNLTKGRRSTSVSLSHQIDEEETICAVKSNSWLIILLTNRNRIILVNFSATVLFSQQLFQNITDVELTQQGKIILSAESGVVLIKNQSTTAKYRQIDQKVKKWFELNDMNWMDGSVWASKNKSCSHSGQISSSINKQANQSLSKQDKQAKFVWGQNEQSIRLGEGTLADLSVSLKQPLIRDIALSYKNDENKRSIFNPTSICAQVNKIYKEVDQLQNKRAEKPKIELLQKSQGQIQLVNPLTNSRPKRRIFGAKEKEQYQPKFSNNFVESFIEEGASAKEIVSTEAQDQVTSSNIHQESVDFNLSHYEEGQPSRVSKERPFQLTKQNQSNILKPQFVESIKQLFKLSQNPNDYENRASIVCEFSEQYQYLYKILEKVFDQKSRQKRKQKLLKKMDRLWLEMRQSIQRQQ